MSAARYVYRTSVLCCAVHKAMTTHHTSRVTINNNPFYNLTIFATPHLDSQTIMIKTQRQLDFMILRKPLHKLLLTTLAKPVVFIGMEYLLFNSKFYVHT